MVLKMNLKAAAIVDVAHDTEQDVNRVEMQDEVEGWDAAGRTQKTVRARCDK